ncbi:MAG: hypothetical protein WBY53_09510 [Acidobacteriaceae bacterium]
MLNTLETLLARLTGRTNWPYATATFDEQLKIGGGAPTFVGSDVETSDIFTYEVDGKYFDSSVREVLGEQNVMGAAGNRVKIQYNPNNPKQCYYAPARPLASRAMFVVVLLVTALAIVLAIRLHH